MRYFSKQEFFGRISRLQEQMKKEKISAVIVNWRPDLFYFSGTAQDAHCIIFSDENPLLLVRRDLRRAKEDTWIDSVYQISGYRELVKYLIEYLQSQSDGAKITKIALALDVFPTNQYLKLKMLLPSSIELIDCSSIIRRIRSIKSKSEVKMMERAAAVARDGHEAVRESLHVGMKETELCAIASKAMLESGHQGFVFFRAWNNELLPQGHCISGDNGTFSSYVASPNGGRGISHLVPQGSSNRKIQKNEPILVDLVGCYHGYCADVTRTYWLGSLPEVVREQLDLCRELENLALDYIRVGEIPSNVYKRVLVHHSESTRSKESTLLMAAREGVGFLGHGVGLEIDEWPVIAGRFTMPFQEGNTMAIEPKIRISRIGLVGVENTHVITKHGLKRLTNVPFPTE